MAYALSRKRLVIPSGLRGGAFGQSTCGCGVMVLIPGTQGVGFVSGCVPGSLCDLGQGTSSSELWGPVCNEDKDSSLK